MRIIFLQRVLPAYREPLFEALRKQVSQAGHDLELWVSPPEDVFAQRGTGGHLAWARQVPVLTPSRRFGGLEWQRLPWGQVISADVMILPDNLRVLSNLAVLLLRRLLRKPVLTWGHGVNFQPTALSRYVARVRGWLIRLADRNLVYTDVCVPPLLKMGFRRERIGITGNAIDTTAAEGLYPTHPEVLDFRKRHQLNDAPCIAFLGSWYARKRPELILAIGKAVRGQVPDARVLVIGGGDGLAALGEGRFPWLKLLGPLHGREKFVALSSARCLAVTGVAGLNLLDAMAVGLPVVVPKREDHSPEVAYLQHEINGLFVSDNVQAMADACAELIRDSGYFARLRAGAFSNYQDLTLDVTGKRITDFAIEAKRCRK